MSGLVRSGQFISAGAGAVARTYEDKARDVFSAMDVLSPEQRADVRACTRTLDTYAKLQQGLTWCGTTVTFFLADGQYRLSQSLVTTVGSNIAGQSDAAVLVAHGAFACLTIDSTAVDVMIGSVRNMRFASTVNGVGAYGIHVIGAAGKFVAKWKFTSLRFSGLYAGIRVNKGHALSGTWYVSFFSVNQITDITVDEWGANESQYGILADGANTLTITGGVIRGRISGIEIGDGATGLGDITITGIQFNYGNQSIKLWGSTTAGHYAHNNCIGVNQYDGNNLKCIWAYNLTRLKVHSANFAAGIDNDIQNCTDSVVDFNNGESRYSVTKAGVGIAAAVPLFRLSPTASGDHQALIRVVVIGTLAGRGQGVMEATYAIRTNAGVPTISAAFNAVNSMDGTGVMSLSLTNVGNEVLFTLNQNSTAINSQFRAFASICSDNHRFVMV